MRRMIKHKSSWLILFIFVVLVYISYSVISICKYSHVYEDRKCDVAKIIVTGGVGKGNTMTDASMARKYLVSVGVPDDVILEEGKSTITQDNLENAKRIMDECGYQDALIVSDPLHMKRAMLLAKDAGIDAYSSPTGTSAYKSMKTKIPFVARETFLYWVSVV